MIFTVLTQSGVLRRLDSFCILVSALDLLYRLNFDLFGFGESQCQLIAVNLQFHWVSHRRKLYNRDLGAGNHTHVKKMLTQSALTANPQYSGALADSQFIQFHSIHFLC